MYVTVYVCDYNCRNCTFGVSVLSYRPFSYVYGHIYKHMPSICTYIIVILQGPGAL